MIRVRHAHQANQGYQVSSHVLASAGHGDPLASSGYVASSRHTMSSGDLYCHGDLQCRSDLHETQRPRPVQASEDHDKGHNVR